MNTKLKDETLIESLKEYSLISTLNLDRNTMANIWTRNITWRKFMQILFKWWRKNLRKNTNNNFEIVPIMKFVESYSTTDEEWKCEMF